MLYIYNFSKIEQGVFEKPASLAFIQRPTKRAQMKWEVKGSEKDDSNFKVQEA